MEYYLEKYFLSPAKNISKDNIAIMANAEIVIINPFVKDFG